MLLDVFRSPEAEVFIDAALVKKLLRNQHEQFAHLPVHIVEAGWDNVMARLGEDLAVRLPRRQVGDLRIRTEQKWLPYLASQLPLPVPEPINFGVPCAAYPYHWSLQKWLPGIAADMAPLMDGEADVLADFLQTLHALPVPDGLGENPNRSEPLRRRDREVRDMMAILERDTDLITPAILQAWDAALAAPIDLPPCWIAGDIHARNVLVQAGKISAMIDWGDMCRGDPATDLSSIWALLETGASRRRAEARYGMSQATIERAKGWAVFFGVFLTFTGRRDTPRHMTMGAAILRRLAEDRQFNG